MIVLVAGVALIALGTGLVTGYLFASRERRLAGEHAARARVRAAEDRLVRSLRSVPVLQPHSGHHVPAAQVAASGSRMPSRLESNAATGGAPGLAGPGASREPVTTPLLAAREHADRMWQAGEQYLPPAPVPPSGQPMWSSPVAGSHPYEPQQDWQSLVSAGRAVEPVRTGEHPPWTGSQPALTPELEAELERQRLIQEQIDQRGPDVTKEDLMEILDELRRPVPAYTCCEHCEGKCDTPGRHHIACIDCQAAPVYGEASVADVLAAEQDAADEAQRQDAGLLT